MANVEPTRTFPAPPPGAEPGESRSTATGQRTLSLAPGAPPPPLVVKEEGSTANRSRSTRYELRRPLGSGAFGLVSLAWDHQLQREVAIKAPRPGLPEEVRRSFLSEAQLVARLRHPSVVVVHGVQVDDAGDPFIVYEYLPGQSLRQKLQPGQPLPLDEALSLAVAIAEGLAAAHKLGLTHRDLKPANILLDAEGRPRIADFGLAIEEGRQSGLKGEVAGTNKYMAPEQVRGEAHHLDGRTDLWALGVILYEMLTGRHPFVADKGEDVLEQILHRSPRPPRQWNPAIPKPVEELVLRLLAKPLAMRPASASEVAEELRKIGGSPSHLATVSNVPSNARIGPFAAGVVGLICLLMIGYDWIRPALTSAVSGIPAGHHAADTRSDPYTPSEFRPGNWRSLLTRRREVGEILFTSDSLRYWSPGGQCLTVKSPFLSLLEIGKTTAEQTTSYSLQLDYSTLRWSGDAGLFIGYCSSPNEPNVDTATLIGVHETSSKKLTLLIRSVQLKRQAGQWPTLITQRPLPEMAVSKASDGAALLAIDVTNSQLTGLQLNNVPIALPALPAGSAAPTQGLFGLYAMNAEARFTSCRFRLASNSE